jgi:hypothetical protein
MDNAPKETQRSVKLRPVSSESRTDPRAKFHETTKQNVARRARRDAIRTGQPWRNGK